jgi:hypothetical protein
VIRLRNIIHRQDMSGFDGLPSGTWASAPVARVKVSLGCKQQAHRIGQQNATPQSRIITALIIGRQVDVLAMVLPIERPRGPTCHDRMYATGASAPHRPA